MTNVIVNKRNETYVAMVKNVFVKKEMKRWKVNVNISNNSWKIVTACGSSHKCDPVGMVAGSPSQLVVPGILWISDQGGFWIKIILNWFWVLSIVLTTSEFLQTFCKKIFRFCTIISWTYHSPQNKLISTCFHGSQRIFSHAILYWIDASRTGNGWSRLGGLPCNWSTWIHEGTVHLSLFLVWAG